MKSSIKEDILKLVQETVSNDQNLIDSVYEIVLKINKCKNEKITSIAKLIGYDPKKSFVEPLTQGTISHYVEQICNKLNIKLERSDDKIGGLAYFNNFMIVKNI